MSEPPDLYAVLQLDPRAEPEVIRAVYLCLAKRHHPDAGGDPARMVALNAAWAVLGDPARRAVYDRVRLSAPPSEPAAANDTREPDARAATHPRETTGATTLDHGRYAGWTLEALADTDPDYLEWLARVPGGRQYRAAILALLAARRAPGHPADGTPQRHRSGWIPRWRTRAWAGR